MRLEKIQAYLKEKQWNYEYTEEDGLGSIDFEHRGLSYHIWEFEDGGYGAETNVPLPWEDRKTSWGTTNRRSSKSWKNLVKDRKERKMFEIAR